MLLKKPGRGFDHYLGYYSGAEEVRACTQTYQTCTCVCAASLRACIFHLFFSFIFLGQHFTHLKSGLGLNKYDLSNNTGDDIKPCLGSVGNASATYSSYLYGNETLRLLAAHDETVPLFIYLAWNNVC